MPLGKGHDFPTFADDGKEFLWVEVTSFLGRHAFCSKVPHLLPQTRTDKGATVKGCEICTHPRRCYDGTAFKWTSCGHSVTTLHLKSTIGNGSPPHANGGTDKWARSFIALGDEGCQSHSDAF